MSSEINDTGNGSMFGDDVFSDANNGNLTLSTIIANFYAAAELTKLLVCTLALCSDIYLIVIISKFQNLQTRINYFIRQYAIFHILYLILANMLFLILELSVRNAYRYNIYCLVGNLDHLTLTLSLYALSFMAFDWYVSNCHPCIYEKYSRTFKHGAYIMYSFAIPKWVATSTFCFINHWHTILIRSHLESASFVFCVLIVVGITILKRKKIMSSEAYKTEYALIIPRTALFWCFLLFILRIMELYLDNIIQEVYLTCLWITDMFVENVFFGMPILIVYQLFKLNKHFRSAYYKCCKKKRVGSYDDDNLDTDSVNEESRNNVTYDRGSEVIYF